MAPTTALAFLALSLALIARMLAPAGSPLRSMGTVLAWVVATLAIVNIALPSVLDELFGGQRANRSRPARRDVAGDGRGARAAGARHRRHGTAAPYAGVLATVAAIVGATVALGYASGRRSSTAAARFPSRCRRA